MFCVSPRLIVDFPEMMDCNLESVTQTNHFLSGVAFCQGACHGSRIETRMAVLGLQTRVAVPVSLCGCWGPEIRSSCLYGKHFTDLAVSTALYLDAGSPLVCRFPQIKSLNCTCLSYLLGYTTGPLHVHSTPKLSSTPVSLWSSFPDSGSTFLWDTRTQSCRAVCGSLFFSQQ